MKRAIYFCIFIFYHSAYCQNTVSGIIKFGPNISIPTYSYVVLNKPKVNKGGQSELGVNIDISVLNDFGKVGVELGLGYSYMSYEYSEVISFPEDYFAGTTSSIYTYNKIHTLTLHTSFIYGNNDNLINFIFGPQVNIPVNNKQFQEIKYGYDPSIINVKNETDNLYDNPILYYFNLGINLNPWRESKFYIYSLFGYNINKAKYKTTNWDVRNNFISCGLIYNIRN